MANDLPEPASRKEQFLAKAAGENVELPTPASREELYLNAIAEGGGGGGTTYTAGDGITITDDTISVDLAQATGDSTKKVMSQNAVTEALATAGDSVYLNGNKSAIYIGDSSTTLTKNFTALNGIVGNNSAYAIAIGGGEDKAKVGDTTRAYAGIAIGSYATIKEGGYNVAIGRNSFIQPGAGNTDTLNVAIGDSASINGTAQNPIKNAVALGANAKPTRTGEVNVGAQYGGAYNNTNYRVLGGVHDGVDAHDAVTIGQINALIDAINSATSSNISHIGS